MKTFPLKAALLFFLFSLAVVVRKQGAASWRMNTCDQISRLLWRAERLPVLEGECPILPLGLQSGPAILESYDFSQLNGVRKTEVQLSVFSPKQNA